MSGKGVRRGLSATEIVPETLKGEEEVSISVVRSREEEIDEKL
jgi:hypothetical protein